MFALALATTARIAQPQEDVAERFHKAVELQRQGNWKEAIAAYRALLKLSPDHAQAQANLGVALLRAGRYDEAVAAYEAAFKLDSKLTPVLLNLGIAHFQKGQFAKAVDTLDRFLQEHPDHLQAQQLAGMSLVELGKDADAIARLEPALPQMRDAAALYSLGLAYLRLRRPEAAEVQARLATNENGEILAQLLKGQIDLEALEYEKAASELQAAADRAPDLPRVHVSLGIAQMKVGQTEAARLSFEQELKRAPDDFLTLYSLALLLEQQGQLAPARQQIESALKQEPESPEAGALLGRILLAQNQAAEAVRVLQQVVAKRPTDDQTRYLLARAYQKLGRRQDAAREFAEVARLKSEKRDRERR